MSLPPGFLDELRTRLSLGQVVGRKVAWDPRKSNQSKGDLWAPCPFHQEKTASFHVDDRKGYYYCFGCHAKGDAISFVRETENVGFMEAVEILAGEAGLPMPARDPKAQEKADRRSQLIEVMEQAVQFYRLQLKTAAGAEARAYLADRRGLDDGACNRWDIGFAPPSWQALWDHLRGKGVAEDLILGAGLAKESTKGRDPYDTFRNRILFPIRDGRGRAIAFGGRAMDPDDTAKYLNSPETEIFDKGRTLFNMARAREASGRDATLVVAEGYMDVIALAEAGFPAAVAPLGTAITEAQLELLWRLHPEPVVALDGDKAGLRAAERLIDLALPLVGPGRALRFVVLPEGKDPDDLIRDGGASAMTRVLEEAQPLVKLLWRRETEGKVFDSPERRAALDAALRTAIGKIPDQGLRTHYGEEIRQLRRVLFGQGQFQPGGGGQRTWKPKGPDGARAATRGSALALEGFDGDQVAEAAILATLAHHPDLLAQFAEDLDRLDCAPPHHRAVRDALLVRAAGGTADIPGEALEKLMATRHVRIAPALRVNAPEDIAVMTINEALQKLLTRRGHVREVEDAIADIEALADEGLTWRLAQSVDAKARAERGLTDDRVEYETGPNGARIRRDEKGALEALLNRLDSIIKRD
ncbi:MAG: DNA primase [Pseudomonadota bacterium]